MKAIKIKITSFISNDQPGFVECIFYDALNNKHIVQDKVTIVTDMDLDANSKYPQDGIIVCEILKQWTDTNGKTIFTVNTTKPVHIDTVDGLTEFDLYEEQLTEYRR